MRAWKGLVFAICSAAMCLTAVPKAQADEWNKKTIVTLSDSLEVLGTVLQPGTYVFQLADSPSDRHIVQIWTEDGQYLITTILAVPAYRVEVTDRSVFELDERPVGAPMALRKWFYPGDNSGQEFVYRYGRYNEPRYEARAQYNR